LRGDLRERDTPGVYSTEKERTAQSFCYDWCHHGAVGCISSCIGPITPAAKIEKVYGKRYYQQIKGIATIPLICFIDINEIWAK